MTSHANAIAGATAAPEVSRRDSAAGAKHPASFRDPNGMMFRGKDGRLYRQINHCGEEDYRQLMDSGLYRQLVDHQLLIDHVQAPSAIRLTDEAALVLRPRELPFISYPYEWPFGALKAAALLTLEIQQRALRLGMTLKDASAYNVQFEGTSPIFIDTLSFEAYREGEPWAAYGQYCRHFLAPLALMSAGDVRLNRMLSVHLDGVPLDLASKLLPFKTRFRLGLLVHLHLHAKMVRRCCDTSSTARRRTRRPPKIRKRLLLEMISSLKKVVSHLHWQPAKTEWADYYDRHSYSGEAQQRKRQFVSNCLDEIRPQSVWDLGSNTGAYSRLASERGAQTTAFDADQACVEKMFIEGRNKHDARLLPLCMDLTNPSPAIGWAHAERLSLVQRGPADLVLALALVHHLAISNNLPFDRIFDFLHKISRRLIIEFVPKDDPQVVRLLQSRPDSFNGYTQRSFEAALKQRFSIVDAISLEENGRALYLAKSERRSL